MTTQPDSTENQHWAKLPVDKTTMEPADTAEPLRIENADGTRYSITIGPKRFHTAVRALAEITAPGMSWDDLSENGQRSIHVRTCVVLEGAGFTVNSGTTS